MGTGEKLPVTVDSASVCCCESIVEMYPDGGDMVIRLYDIMPLDVYFKWLIS